MSRQLDAKAIAAKLQAKGMGIKYTRMRQNRKNPHSAPYRRRTSKIARNDPIDGMSVFPVGNPPTGNYVFIKLDATLRALVIDNLKEFEDNYFKHVFGLSSYLDASEGDFERMERYFNADRLGLTEIATDDPFCWRMTTVASDPRLATASSGSSKKGKGKGSTKAKAILPYS